MALARELPKTLGEALSAAKQFLARSPALVRRGSVDAEAELIVAAAYRQAGLGELRRIDLYSRLGEPIGDRVGGRVLSMASSRAGGKILQHLTGTQFFLEHEYEVSPAVLVPRPETEILAAVALEHLGAAPPSRGLEVGLGSGILSIELLARLPRLEMLASEWSDAAAAVAESNARRILGAGGAGGEGASRLRRVKPATALEVLEPLVAALGGERADFLISNPPYVVKEGGDEELDAEVRDQEPHEALFAPPEDALHFYREIALKADRALKPGAPVFLELPSERAFVILTLFERPGWREPKLLKDLNGRDRVLVAILK